MDFTQIDIAEQAAKVPYLALVYLAESKYDNDIERILECHEINARTYLIKYIADDCETNVVVYLGSHIDPNQRVKLL
jgi:hypothetical protein